MPGVDANKESLISTCAARTMVVKGAWWHNMKLIHKYRIPGSMIDVSEEANIDYVV